MDIHGALLDIYVASPHPVEELRSIEGAVWMTHQQFEQPKLRGPHGHRLIANANAVGARIEAEASVR